MIDLQVHFPRPRPGRAMPTQGAEHSLVVGLAREVRRRRIKTGKGPEQKPRYDDKGRKMVSPRYPEARGGEVAPSGAKMYRSSREFHQQAGAEAGSGFVSGGLWSGLALLIRGATRSRLAFRGRSEGQDPNFRRYKSGAVKAKGKKQSNALKGATVLAAHDVNLIEPTDEEVESVTLALAEVLRQGVIATLPLSDEGSTYAVSAMAQRILRAVEAHEQQIGARG